MDNHSPPPFSSPRFTLELEFVLSLSNPHYLQHLAMTYPSLFTSSTPSSLSNENDATKFTAYLSYLYAYWRTPQYVKFLTHPGATLNMLRLLQEERFRGEVGRPDVVAALLGSGLKVGGEEVAEDAGERVLGEERVDGMDEGPR
jgi:mediator of RNA polymerase II transcription subunit 31